MNSPPTGSEAARLRSSAEELAEIYWYLRGQGVEQLDSWVMARNVSGVKLHKAILLAYGSDSTWKKRYQTAYQVAVSHVEQAAYSWALKTLRYQGQALFQLKKRLLVPGTDDRLHEIARRVLDRAGSAKADQDELKAALAKSQGDKGYTTANEMWETKKHADELARTRRKRMAAALREELAGASRDAPALDPREMKAADNRQELKPYVELLATIFAHPDGVAILDAYEMSPVKGTEVTTAHLQEAIDATKEFTENLDQDEVWRYPPVVVGGLTSLGLQDIDGFPEFAVDLGRNVLGVSGARVVLGHASMVLFCVGLVFTGGTGAVVIVLDLAVTGLDATLAYVEARDQELAAEATAFRPEEERFSAGGDFGEAGLAGAAALVSAVALLAGPAKKLLQVKPRGIDVPPPDPLKPKRARYQRDPETGMIKDEALGDLVSTEISRKKDSSLDQKPPAAYTMRGQMKQADDATGSRAILNKNIEERGIDLDSKPSGRMQLDRPRQSGSASSGQSELPDWYESHSYAEQTSGVTETPGMAELDTYMQTAQTASVKHVSPMEELSSTQHPVASHGTPEPIIHTKTRAIDPNALLPVVDPIQDLLDFLRRNSVPPHWRARAKVDLPPGAPDPAFPSLTVDVPTVDHAYALARIIQIPEFAQLSLARQLQVVSIYENFVIVSERANSSKQHKSYFVWNRHEELGMTADPTWLKQMQARELAGERAVRRKIRELLVEQRGEELMRQGNRATAPEHRGLPVPSAPGSLIHQGGRLLHPDESRQKPEQSRR